MDILVGVQLIEAAALRAEPQRQRRSRHPRRGNTESWPPRDMPAAVKMASSPELKALMIRNADRRRATTYSRELAVIVDREKARFSAWYEMFPRSSSASPAGTELCRTAPKDWTTLPGWDLTFSTFRPFIPSAGSIARERTTLKRAAPDDVGSPWAIGAREGGHKAIDPQSGNARRFQAVACRAPRSWESKWRSTSPTSARPTILT